MLVVAFGGFLFIFGVYMLYVAISLFRIPNSEYNTYKKGLSSFINTVKGDNSIEVAGAVHGDSRDQNTGELYSKSSYSPEHTKRLIESASK